MSVFAAVDLGSKKIAVAIARRQKDGRLRVLSVHHQPSRGIERGRIVNLLEASELLKEAVEEAERNVDLQVNDIFINVGGKDAEMIQGTGRTYVVGNAITKREKRRAVENAGAVSLPPDREVLHILPFIYIVNDMKVEEPEGMLGNSLDVKVQVVTHSNIALRNLEQLVKRVGFFPKKVILNHVAVPEALITDEDREAGIMVVDMGAETTDVSLIHRKMLYRLFTYEVGGKDFTKDISVKFGITMKEAERMKIKHVSLLDEEDETGSVSVTLLDGSQRILTYSDLTNTILPRAERLFAAIKQDIEAVGWQLPRTNGIVLTGGGAQLKGLREYMARYFSSVVRLSGPRNFEGILDFPPDHRGPEFSLLVGLLHFTKNMEGWEDRGDSLLQKIGKIFRKK